MGSHWQPSSLKKARKTRGPSNIGYLHRVLKKIWAELRVVTFGKKIGDAPPLESFWAFFKATWISFHPTCILSAAYGYWIRMIVEIVYFLKKISSQKRQNNFFSFECSQGFLEIVYFSNMKMSHDEVIYLYPSFWTSVPEQMQGGIQKLNQVK